MKRASKYLSRHFKLMYNEKHLYFESYSTENILIIIIMIRLMILEISLYYSISPVQFSLSSVLGEIVTVLDACVIFSDAYTTGEK